MNLYMQLEIGHNVQCPMQSEVCLWGIRQSAIICNAMHALMFRQLVEEQVGRKKMTTDIHDSWTGLMMYDACDDEVLMLTEHTASRHDAEKQSNYRRCVCGISISESLMMPQLLFKAHTAH